MFFSGYHSAYIYYYVYRNETTALSLLAVCVLAIAVPYGAGDRDFYDEDAFVWKLNATWS